MRAELKSRDGTRVAEVEIDADPAPGGLMYGPRSFRRVGVKGFGAGERTAVYAEDELLILPSEAARGGGES